MTTDRVPGSRATTSFLLAVALVVAAYFTVADFSGSPVQPPCWTRLPQAYGLSTGAGTYFFGNIASGGYQSPVWEVPNETLVSTSYVLGRPLNVSITMSVYKAPSGSSQDTNMYLGLYLDGTLVSNNTLVNPPSGGETQIYSVRWIPFGCPIPAGTEVTMTFYAATPIFIQTSQGESSHMGPAVGGSNFTAPAPSYEFPGASPLPATIPSPSTGVRIPSLVMEGEGE